MDTKRLILYLAAIIVLGPLLLTPLLTRSIPRTTPAPIGTVNGPSVSVANSFGGSNVNINTILCAGKVSLSQGSATVSDTCFTGDSNIVICSDVSSPSGVRCEPGKGSLAVEGHANDAVAYARVK
jgi:hypothetical protein